MILPHVDTAVIAREKIVEYLLNPEHPDGAGKAKFFLALGFAVEKWDVFAESLRQVAMNNEVAHKKVSSNSNSGFDGERLSVSASSCIDESSWIRLLRTP